MGVNYYMVKGKEKYYIGSNIIVEEIPELYEIYQEVSENHLRTERYEEEDYMNTSLMELTIRNLHQIGNMTELLDNTLRLLEHVRLLYFFVETDYDPMDGIWECVGE